MKTSLNGLVVSDKCRTCTSKWSSKVERLLQCAMVMWQRRFRTFSNMDSYTNVNSLPKLCRNTLFTLAVIIFSIATRCSCATRNVHAGNPEGPYVSIKAGNVYDVKNPTLKDALTTFCWPGERKTLLGIWKTSTVQLTMPDDNFQIYKGENASHVEHLHDILQQSWFSFLPWKEKSVSISPFNTSCMGVYTKADYSLKLDLRQINFNRFIMFAVGMLLFFVAPTLCEKVVFHYTTGTLIGVLGSVLILVYLVSRLIPKKSGAYAVLLGGSSVVFYLLRNLWENLFSVLNQHYYYVMAYLVSSSVISFAVCYRFGPVSNPRTVNLLQWTLQAIGLLLVFSSSEHKEAAMAIILVTVIGHNFPRSLTSRILSVWFHKFPPKVRLLTEDEYNEQGYRETKKELDKLREFSKSPNCNAWKTMSRLRDPIRFAEFVEGQSHLSDREVLDYETSSLMPTDADLTDDESSEE